MMTIRRSNLEPRVEIMPLIDVIFLLLTFFIYAFVFLAPVNVLPIDLPELVSGTSAEQRPAISVAIRLDGTVMVNEVRAAVGEVARTVSHFRTESPESIIYLALEDGEGTVDRGLIMQRIIDQLSRAGLDVSFVGTPADIPDASAGEI